MQFGDDVSSAGIGFGRHRLQLFTDSMRGAVPYARKDQRVGHARLQAAHMHPLRAVRCGSRFC
jgi:hypothetical protein